MLQISFLFVATVAWRPKNCASAISKEIKVQENVWLNMNLVIRMGTMDVDCMKECLKLGRNQTDTDAWEKGCKLRPDEGLDSISSLSPAGLGAELLVGGTNTVYAWLIQWLVDNLGYDVTTIIGLPYDWRLSPDKMEKRDGFLQALRRRLEAAVATQGQPGIMVARKYFAACQLPAVNFLSSILYSWRRFDGKSRL
jgi:Lecithin:cholesterol acyltransferase